MAGLKYGKILISDIPGDELDELASVEPSPITFPRHGKKIKSGEYDFLSKLSTKAKLRLAGANLTRRQNKLSSGTSIDQMHQIFSSSERFGGEVSGMNSDEFGEWYFKKALRGLNLRREARQSPGFRRLGYRGAYQAKVAAAEEAAMADKFSDERNEFLKRSSDEYRESFRAQVFSDDNFIGNNSYEYDLAQKMRADAAAVSGMYDEANEASFRLVEEMEAGRRPISRPLTFKMSGTQGEGLVSAYDTSLRVGQPAFIVDIDETLLTGTKKAGRIENKLLALKASRPVTSAEWYPWNEAAKQAKPIKPMIDFVKGLEEAGIQPVFMTARDEALREFTTERLRKLGLDPKYLYMRGLSQEQADLSPTALKAGMLDEIGKRFNFVGVMDDSASVVEMAFKRGASFGMVPPKGGFDSIEASIQRGLETAGKAGSEAVERMNEAIRPIVSAGARSGKMSESTFNKILDVADVSKALLKGRL